MVDGEWEVGGSGLVVEANWWWVGDRDWARGAEGSDSKYYSTGC